MPAKLTHGKCVDVAASWGYEWLGWPEEPTADQVFRSQDKMVWGCAKEGCNFVHTMRYTQMQGQGPPQHDCGASVVPVQDTSVVESPSTPLAACGVQVPPKTSDDLESAVDEVLPTSLAPTATPARCGRPPTVTESRCAGVAVRQGLRIALAGPC